MKKVAILGSTGSIGTQALDVIAAHADRFSVVGLAANTNVELLAEQTDTFKPAIVSVGADDLLASLSARLTHKPRNLTWGPEGLLAVASDSGADILLAATDGMTSLAAVHEAIRSGVDIALANKELAVAAGEILFALAETSGSQILPVDSEHCAVHQCLLGEDPASIASIVLTASGGPFWDYTLEAMSRATPEEALRHPTWQMGAKNTLDSATLMNKGLEVIEASRFFRLQPAQIEVVVHRQSIAHAFVIFKDGSVKAQLAWPDMRIPIGYALSYPQRLPLSAAETTTDAAINGRDYKGRDYKTRAAIGLSPTPSTLTFECVDTRRFPALKLAYRALEAGGTVPAVLSATNEEAGRAFLQGKIRFTDIGMLVERALDAHAAQPASLPAIAAADAFARNFVREHLGEVART